MSGGCETSVSLLSKGHSHTCSLRQRDGWSLSVSNDQDEVETSGERVASGVLEVGDVVGTDVSLDVLESSDSTDVVTSDKEHGSSVLELENALDGSVGEVHLKY